VILNIDPERKRISLGLKQTEEDPWYELAQQYEPGTEVEGQVVRLLDKGMVVDLGDEVEGFVPLSHVTVEDEDRVDEPADLWVEGDDVELRVLESDPINRRIVLTVIGRPEVDEEIAEAGDEDAEDGTEVEPGGGVEAEPEAGVAVEEAGEEDAEDPPESRVEAEPEAGVAVEEAGDASGEVESSTDPDADEEDVEDEKEES